jgi:Mn-dependent DtxR family transcriptional regulator
VPRGVPLTPEQIAQIATLFATTGNAAEVARQMGLDTSTVTRALGKIPEQERAILHREALVRGFRNGRRRLEKVSRKVGREFVVQLDAGSVEPAHIAQMTSALTAINRELVRMDLLEIKRRQARLTRAETRARIELVKAQTEKLRQRDDPEGGDVTVVIACEPPPAGPDAGSPGDVRPAAEPLPSG